MKEGFSPVEEADCSLQPEWLLVSLEGMLGMGIGVEAAVRLPEEMQKRGKSESQGMRKERVSLLLYKKQTKTQ